MATFGETGLGGTSEGGLEGPAFVASLGRISGKLLNADLRRNGVDLSFRNGATDADLLYLDVNSMRVGINTESPTVDLDVSGKVSVSNNFQVDGNYAKFDNIIFQTDGTVTTSVGPIEFLFPEGDSYFQIRKMLSDDLEISDNYIKSITENSNIGLTANGTGAVTFQSRTDILGNTEVTGNIFATGDINIRGKFIIGDSPIDTIVVVPDFSQSIIPGDDSLYDLGSEIKQWANIEISDQLTGNIEATELTVGYQTTISGNSITSIQSNDNLIFNSSTGTVQLESLEINQGTITNLLNSPIRLNSTGTGFVTFTDSGAFAVPVGTSAERVGSEIGETRWNTDLQYLECFDGTIWQVATGGGVVVTPAIMKEFADIYTLMLG